MSFIQLHKETVKKDWIDYNGHMNVAFYVLAFDHATDAVLEKVHMGPAYRHSEEKSIFVVESHVTYEGEVMERDGLEIQSYILGYDQKRLHLFHEMFSSTTKQKCATNEIMALHVDLKTRKTAVFSSDLQNRLESLCRQSWQGGLPDQLGRQISRLGDWSKK
ncbi:MAG: thioesterase family protein [Methylocystaceae bacterium]|nr:thioesterase family protein [Methylocystaceae bacterium]